jgi:SAM-dependent methyltransferase
VSSDHAAAWLVENVHYLAPTARVLDVACGKGRNAKFVAATGRPVHAIDRDAQALSELLEWARARKLPLTTEPLDLETDLPSLGHAQYDAVIVFNYLHRPLIPVIIEALAPGGYLLYETFTVGQAARGHPRNPDFLLRDGELPRLIWPLVVVRAREGDVDGKLIASVVAQKQ